MRLDCRTGRTAWRRRRRRHSLHDRVAYSSQRLGSFRHHVFRSLLLDREELDGRADKELRIGHVNAAPDERAEPSNAIRGMSELARLQGRCLRQDVDQGGGFEEIDDGLICPLGRDRA
jgi:hypothetical protein